VLNFTDIIAQFNEMKADLAEFKAELNARSTFFAGKIADLELEHD